MNLKKCLEHATIDVIVVKIIKTYDLLVITEDHLVIIEENKSIREKKCNLFVASTPNAEDIEGSKFYFGEVQDTVFKVDDSQ